MPCPERPGGGWFPHAFKNNPEVTMLPLPLSTDHRIVHHGKTWSIETGI